MGCSKMKFDKVDKIFTCFVLIIVTIFCFLNTFCFASEMPGTQVDGVLLSGIGFENGKFISKESDYVLYYHLKAGHTYTYYNVSNTNRYALFSDEEPAVGVSGKSGLSITANSSYTFEVEKDSYIYFSVISGSSQILLNNSLYDISSGFSVSIMELFNNVGFSQLWLAFDGVIPYVLVVVLFAFGWWFFAHWIKEISKGREF